MAKFVALLAVALLVTADASTAQAGVQANPIRKVVTMLQMMQKKVTEEGEKADELFEKYECYCKSSGGDLAASIEAAEARIGELGPDIEASTGKKAQLEEALTGHQADRDAAKKAMAEATAIREKEKEAYDKSVGENMVDLAALHKAVAALEQGMGGSFLQTWSADVLRAFLGKSREALDSDRQEVLAFLSAKEGEEYAPQSGEIVGILKQMGDEMFKDQQDMNATETSAVQAYEELMAAKKTEISVLSKSIEDKLERVAKLGVEIAEMKNDLGDSTESLAEDKKFVADLEKNCADKKAVHEEEKKMRAQEIVALADTIKVLNDDDALELFKKTLPSAGASLMQLQSTSASLRAQAKALLAQVSSRVQPGQGRHRLDFISLALSGKKIGFDKVIQLIDELVATLKTEQEDDDHKKEYCGVQLDESDDKKKALERSISNLETTMAETKEEIATAAEEIAALQAGIKALDKSVAEATEQRQSENAEYKDLMANNGAAKEVILFAKNRLNQYYNPKLYKAPPKVELSREDRIFVNQGGTVTTAAPGGIAGTGIKVAAFLQLRQEAAPPPPPETAEAYKAKSEESNGVMEMMDLLVKDLDKEMTVAESEEKEAQKEYEQMMKDSAEKRAMDSKALSDREGAKADLESLLEASSADHKSAGKDLSATLKYIQSLHGECDWLLQYFDVRKQARADEVDSLGKAKAVLSGADYALVQTASRSRSRKFLRHA